MLELVFTLDDLARTRMAISPLWEAVASIQTLRRQRPPAMHRHWVSRTQRRLNRSSVDLDLLFELASVTSWYTPDFLSPPPRSPVPDLTAELAALRGTPAEQVRADLRVLGHARETGVGTLDKASLLARQWRSRPALTSTEGLRALYDDPVAGLDKLADQILTYWDLAIGPYWGRIRSLLEGDVLYRSRQLAEGGAAHLFADLAPNVRWRDHSLVIRHRRFSGRRQLDGEGILLIPSAFVWPSVVSAAIPPWQPNVTYPARAVATLWDVAGADAPAAVRGVLGRTRAMVLAHLESPSSTSDLAARMGLTPGGVSHHLSLLRAAGLVTPHRVGHSVLYARTAVAESLLGAAGSA
jgi:DNA-binding transcriptional ArsR family regulator